MDYMPPPQVEPLIISVYEASYDEPQNIASIKIHSAFGTSKIIRAYGGSKITLIYQDTNPDLKNCPIINVTIRDVRRNIDFSENSVTLKISNIEKEVAKNIEKALCFRIDANIVKVVSSINYDPHSPDGIREISENLND